MKINRRVGRIVLCLILIIGSNLRFNSVFSQDFESLWKIWKNDKKPDSIQFKAIDDIVWNYFIFDNPDSALYYVNLQYEFALKNKLVRFQAVALNSKGVCYYVKDDLDKAIKYYEQSLVCYKKVKEKQGEAAIYNNLGNIYKEKGDFVKAIDFYVLSMQIDEKLKNKLGVATCMNNIGILYAAQEKFDIAIGYYKKAIKLRKEVGDREGLANPLNNIGNILESKKDYFGAIDYYNRSLIIEKENKSTLGEVTSLSNIAGVYKALGQENSKNKKLSKKYLEKSFKLSSDVIAKSKNLGDNSIIATAYLNLATLKEIEGDSKTAIEYAQKALKISEENGSVRYIRDAAEVLYLSYKKKGDTEQTLKMFETFIQMRDSIMSEENKDEIIRQEYKYEYERQAAADSVMQAKEKEVTNAQLHQEKTQRFALYGGLFLVLVFAGFIFNRYKVTIKQKEIISLKEQETQRQKTLLEIKNKEITDSITYAKRIQAAILPPAKIVKEYLKESFILYKPRDIVAGDFYWMEQIPDGLIFAAADCTGHGVPGALVSVVCNNALNRSVREYSLTEPAQILDKARELIISEFEKSDDDMKDGMDISLCALVYEPVQTQSDNSNDSWSKIVLKWAGANNPLWILRNNEIIEYKGDKQPIGVYLDPRPFTTHLIELRQNDIIYIFTDGFQDQFGGNEPSESGKKIKTSRMKELFLSISHKSMDEQRILIDTMFENWKGDLEQVDDVCVIGVRI